MPILILNQFNQNSLNAANSYINNFREQYADDDDVPTAINILPQVELPNTYDRMSYDFAVAYKTRYQHRQDNQHRPVGGRRRRQSRRSRRQHRQRRSRKVSKRA